MELMQPLAAPRILASSPQLHPFLAVRTAKSGHGLEVHFGLKRYDTVTLEVRLMDGARMTTSAFAVDRFVDLDVTAGTVTTVGG